MPERRQPNLQSIRDHDLLIRLDQKVDALSTDIRDLKDNLATRVNALEVGKADKSVVDILVTEVKQIREEDIPNLRTRIAYYSGAIAVIVALFELYFKLHH